MFDSQAPSQASVTLKVEFVATSRIRKKTKPTGCEPEDTPPPPIQGPEETTLLGWVSHFLINFFIRSVRAPTITWLDGTLCVNSQEFRLNSFIHIILLKMSEYWSCWLLNVNMCSVLLCVLYFYSCNNKSPLGSSIL